MTDKTIFRVEDIFSIMGVGTILTGKLTSGVLKKGMKTNINGKMSEVNKIEFDHKSSDTLLPNVPAGISMSNIDKSDVQAGSEYLFV